MIVIVVILWFYLIGLLIHHLRAVNIVAGVTIACVIGWAIVYRRAIVFHTLSMGSAQLAIALAVVCLFAGPILLEPLTAWDARSIWFFHAKQIFFDDGLNLTRGWNNPEYGLFHPAYPKLLPLLAAEAAYIAGMWNEYLPKASLLVLLTPIVLALLSLARGARLSASFLSLMFLLGPGEMIRTGYPDGYLALYTGMGLLFLSRWLDERGSLDLIAGVLYLGVALNLKNEGALIALCAGICGLLFLRWPHVDGQHLGKVRELPVYHVLAIILPLTTYVAWSIIRNRWGLSDDLLGGNSFQRGFQRMNGGDIFMIIRATFMQSYFVWTLGLLFAAVVAAKLFHIRPRLSSAYPMIVGVLYAIGLCVVYLATPYSLAWHLQMSADRVMLVPIYGVIASVYLILHEIESRAMLQSSA